MTKRETLEARLARKCAKLYDSRTSAAKRRDLSLEVSILRARLSGTRDPLAAMMRASVNEEEC
jgi:hypothetical protein